MKTETKTTYHVTYSSNGINRRVALEEHKTIEEAWKAARKANDEWQTGVAKRVTHTTMYHSEEI